MRLHLSPSIIARPLRNLGYTPGRDIELPYTVRMDPTDYPLGITIVAASLVIAQDFGSQALATRQITNLASAAGQITDDGGTDGIAALFFFVDAATITVYRSLGPIVFEVVLTDSRGYQATLDSGSLVPALSTATEPVASVTVAPSAVALDVGQTQQLTVTAYDINGNVLPGRTVTYQSSASSNATVSPTGLITGVASGAALITATCEGKTGTCNATVTPVDHVTIAPSPLSIAKFGTQQFTGIAYDLSNVPLNNRVFTWLSSNPATASIDASGMLTAHLGGSVTITGTSEGKSAQSAVTVTVTVDQMTPPEFITAFNALGGTTVGATVRGLFIRGVNQTIRPNGDPLLPSPGTNSPTGFWCPAWDDATNSGQGKHLRPSAGVNGGNGAPCLANGHLAGQGLEWPASVGFSMGTAETVSRAFVAGRGGLSDVLTDRGAGFMVGAFGNMENGTYVFWIGENTGSDITRYSGDFGFGREALADAAQSGYLDGFFSTTPTQHHMAMWCATINGTPSGLWSQDFMYFGRDLMWHDSSINVNDGTFGPTPSSNTTAVRRIRVLLNGGNTVTQYGGLDCLYALGGRMNAAQRKLFQDWGKVQSWGTSLWEDPRTRLTYYMGDSLFTSSVQNMSRGSNGAAAIPSHAIVNIAQAGDYTEKRLYHLVEIFRDLDFSRRTSICMFGPGEWVNDKVSDNNPTNCLTRNYFWADALRLIDAKIKIVLTGQTYANAGTLTDGQTMRTDLQAHALAHADVFFDQIDTLPFSAWHFQDGQLANQKPTFFDGTSHWTAFANEYFDAMCRNSIIAAYGLSDAALPYKIDPNVTNVSLTAGAPTNTPTWTVKNRAGTTLVGRTLTFSSLDTGIATVNASTGLITRVAVGTARIKAVTDLGAVGEIDAVCT